MNTRTVLFVADLIQDPLIYCLVILFHNCHWGFRIVLGHLNTSFRFYSLQGHNQIARKTKLTARPHLFCLVFLRTLYQIWKGFHFTQIKHIWIEFKANEPSLLSFCLHNMKGNGIRNDYAIHIANLDACFVAFLYISIAFKKEIVSNACHDDVLFEDQTYVLHVYICISRLSYVW